MTMEQVAGSGDGRSWQRQNCGREGAFVMDGLETRVIMVDASRGGFKLRFENVEGAMAVLTPPPRDIAVSNADGAEFFATVLWARDGMAGCRFYQHVSLDDVVTLMTSRFRVQLPKPEKN